MREALDAGRAAAARRALEAVSAERDALRRELAAVQDAAGEAYRLAEAVRGSITWRALERARRTLHRPDGTRNLAGRAVSRGLRAAERVAAGRVVGAAAPPPAAGSLAAGPVAVPSTDRPVVSIVVPVYGEADMVAGCLRAIASSAPPELACEVVAVNDLPGDAASRALLDAVPGLRVHHNADNIGFLRSVNRGVALSRGAFVVLLNSDTEPVAGWLEALIDRFLVTPRAGAVGCRLVYPDGLLQEAGGIVFSDGNAWNYGNREDPNDTRFTFARPVDFCSAAALMVRREAWDDAGGFDPHFAPAYYEDTDLCFRIRELGAEVWYEPRATVIHKEGGSHGTDLEVGVKRHQVLNRERFADRWAHRLAAHHPAPAPRALPAAADRRTGPRVLVYDHMIPAPDRDAGSQRMMSMLASLCELGARPVFMPSNGADAQPYRAHLERMGVQVSVAPYGWPPHDELRRLGESVDIAILSRVLETAPILPFVREHLPRARVIFDTVDLHHLREEGRLRDDPVRGRTVPGAYRELELALMRACDTTLVASSDERRVLAEADPSLDVMVVPMAHEVRTGTPDADERSGLVFVGCFRHPPNVDAARWLGAEIWPLVRRRCPEELRIIGPDAPADVAAIAADGVAVVGWVPELEPVLDGALAMIAPLRFGAGMKGKVTQSLASGLPVITTAIGAQGLPVEDGVSVLLAETAEEFADAVARLRSDRGLWRTLARNGREVVHATCSHERMRERMAALLEASR